MKPMTIRISFIEGIWTATLEFDGRVWMKREFPSSKQISEFARRLSQGDVSIVYDKSCNDSEF